MLITDIQGQAQQLVGAFHGFGLDDQRNAQVNGREGVEVDFRRQWVLGKLAIALGRPGVGLGGRQVFFQASVMAWTFTGSIRVISGLNSLS